MEIAVKGDRSHKEQYKAALEAYKEALRLASPQDAWVPILRQRVEALKNYLDFLSNEDVSAYKRPLALIWPKPKYTNEARRAGVQGKILLIAELNEQGEVVGCIVLQGLGYGLDEEAIRAVRMTKFSPATKDGVPVSFWQQMYFEFSLQFSLQ